MRNTGMPLTKNGSYCGISADFFPVNNKKLLIFSANMLY